MVISLEDISRFNLILNRIFNAKIQFFIETANGKKPCCLLFLVCYIIAKFRGQLEFLMKKFWGQLIFCIYIAQNQQNKNKRFFGSFIPFIIEVLFF